MSMNKAEEIFCLKNGAKIMLFPIIFIDQLFSGGRRQNKPYFWHLFFGSLSATRLHQRPPPTPTRSDQAGWSGAALRAARLPRGEKWSLSIPDWNQS
jgi:hypothetical protein